MAIKIRVQRPSPGPFTRDKLTWDERSTAHIQAEKFLDFVLGETNRIYPRTVFLGDESRLDNTPGSAKSISEDSLYSKKKSYHCAFGPEDRSRIPKQEKRDSVTKLGCQCRFEYRRLRSNPDVVCIRFEEQGHVTSDGRQSHGTSHPGFLGFHQYDHRISDEIKFWIFYRSQAGFSTTQILAKHREKVLSRMRTEGIKYRTCRDDFLKLSDIQNVASAANKGTWRDRAKEQRIIMERARPIMEEYRQHVFGLWPARTRCEALQDTNPNTLSGSQVGAGKQPVDLSSSSQQEAQDIPFPQAAADQFPEVTSQPTDVDACLREMAKGPQLAHSCYPFMLDNVKEAMKGFQTDQNKRKQQPSPAWR